MTIDLTKYANIKNTVDSVCKYNSGKSSSELISLISVASNAPIIVSAYYYAAHVGKITPEIQKQIDVVVKFYGYSNIVGIESVLNQNEPQ